MSEFLPSVLAGNMPMEAGPVPSSQPGGSSDGSEVSDFASLIADMNFDSATAEVPALDAPPGRPGLTDPLLLASLVDGETQNPTNIDPLATVELQISGNSLPLSAPIVAISGFGMQANQAGASVIAFQGDAKNMMTTGVQYANAIAPALQQPQLQLSGMMQPTAMLQEMEALAAAKIEMAKSIDMLSPLQQQQNLSTLTDSITSLTGQPSGHATMGLQGVTEFSNILAASTRSPEPMTATLNQPQWNNQIGDRIHWMISQGLRQADIRLNPPELGMLEVRIHMQGDQATIQFNTAHADVKDALDSALPRLREMLAENGLNLADVNVSHQGQQQAKHDEGSNSNQGISSSELDSEQITGIEDIKSFSGNGVIDFYA